MKPFMPYMGGKRKMLQYLRPAMPTDFNAFHEPFLGGGALALDVMESHWLAGDDSHTYYLSDYSTDVIDAWTAVKESPDELEAVLRGFFIHHSRSQFNQVRNWDRDGLMDFLSTVEKGARFIYLMQTCFGGIIKTTSDGFLGMGFAEGNADKATGYDFGHLHAVSTMLNALDTRIFRASYEAVLDTAGYGDFIYLDPPYETTDDSGKTLQSEYVAVGIQHEEVKQVILDATAKGSFVLVSNSDTAITRALFEGWALMRPTYFWAGGGGATPASELMVANWRLAEHLQHRQALVA